MIPIIDSVLGIANKFIPDKNARLEFEKEMAKINISDYKEKKTLLEKIVPITFPLLVWVMCLGLLVNVVYGALGKGQPYIVDPLHYELIKWFMIALFGKKIVQKFSK